MMDAATAGASHKLYHFTRAGGQGKWQSDGFCVIDEDCTIRSGYFGAPVGIR
jgi:hypothetical protein